MTSSDSAFNILPLKMPFAGGQEASITTIPDNNDGTNANIPNLVDGFPSIYSNPVTDNPATSGKYVARGDINGLGYIATKNQVARLAGAINTFNQEFSAAVGGYPRGAILDYLFNDKLYHALSLVDNNTTNFLDVGIDGVNWKLCETPSVFNTIHKEQLCIVGGMGGDTTMILFQGDAPFAGDVVVEGSASTRLLGDTVTANIAYVKAEGLTQSGELDGTAANIFAKNAAAGSFHVNMGARFRITAQTFDVEIYNSSLVVYLVG